MRTTWSLSLPLCCVYLYGVAFAEPLLADCNCRSGAPAVRLVAQTPLPPSPLNGTAPLPAAPVPPAPIPEPTQPSAAPEAPPPPAAAPPSHGPPTSAPPVNRFGIAPPPGTLGRTYHRRTILIDDTKHPRVGIVDVKLPEEVDVTARGLKAKWTGKLWRLETAEPLVPGIPHIYAIKAERKDAEGNVLSTDVRWVRLIMGRIVEVDFDSPPPPGDGH